MSRQPETEIAMTILNLSDQAQINTVAVADFLEKPRNAVVRVVSIVVSALTASIQKGRKSPEDILAAEQRRAEAQMRVDRLFSNMR
jgi:hypothetical protein